MIDNQTFVTLCYAAFLRRAPTSAEISTWANALNGGTQSPDNIIRLFLASPEFAHQIDSVKGTATDVANREVVRDATQIQGGTPGFVNGAVRNVDNVGSGDSSFEWAETNIINSAAPAGTENVAEYNQANGTGGGEVWGSVDEVNQKQDAAAVALEIDMNKPAGSADGLGIDFVNRSGLTTEMQGGDGEIIWRDRTWNGRDKPLSAIRSLAGGGFQILVRGAVVFNQP